MGKHLWFLYHIYRGSSNDMSRKPKFIYFFPLQLFFTFQSLKCTYITCIIYCLKYLNIQLSVVIVLAVNSCKHSKYGCSLLSVQITVSKRWTAYQGLTWLLSKSVCVVWTNSKACSCMLCPLSSSEKPTCHSTNGIIKIELTNKDISHWQQSKEKL